jgi:Ca2+-binding EF-hand superfamily protein
MMLGYFDVALPVDASQRSGTGPTGDAREANRGPATRSAAEILKRLDKDGNGRLSRREVPERFQRLFDKLDRDEDGAVSREELSQGLAPRES